MAYIKKVKPLVEEKIGVALSPERIIRPNELTPHRTVKTISYKNAVSAEKKKIVALQSSKIRTEPFLGPQVKTVNECKEYLNRCLVWMEGHHQEYDRNGGENLMDLNLSMIHLGFSLKSLDKFNEGLK